MWTRATRARGVYIALGDSLTAGLDPVQGEQRSGGFVGLVAAGWHRGPLDIVNLACTGEKITTYLDGGRCSYPQKTQAGAARAALKRHGKRVRLVTITLGANDVLACFPNGAPDIPCVTAGLKTLSDKLPGIVRRIAQAAPRARIEVLDYYNPLLARYLVDAQGKATAKASEQLLVDMSRRIDKAATAGGGHYVAISRAFRSGDWSTTTLEGVGPVPVNVATVCRTTYICSDLRDIHPRREGYDLIAKTVLGGTTRRQS